MSRIEETLEKLFDQNRIVFWYDADGELRDELAALELSDVTTVEVNNNEFGVKYRVAREQPKDRFLLYFPHTRPENPENWLLDLLLANAEFQADPASLVLTELGLPYEFRALVREHEAFFKSNERVQKLKAQLETRDTPRAIRMKMVATVCRCEPHIDQIILAMLKEFAEGTAKILSELQRFKLASFVWGRLQDAYGYQSDYPGIEDFLFSLFRANYDVPLGSDNPCLNREAVLLLSRWQDSSTGREAFEKLSGHVAESLGVKEELQDQFWEDLLDLDIYDLVDRKILVDLRDGLLNGTITPDTMGKACRDREVTYWYEKNKHLYLALANAAKLMGRIQTTVLDVMSIDDGLNKYSQTYHLVDRAYRRFIYHWRQSSQSTFLDPLYSRIEKLYSNQFLLPLNDEWQQRAVDPCDSWEAEAAPRQDDFFERFVHPYLDDEKKLFVIVSDALRYEAAAEFHECLIQEDRFTSELSNMLGCLPSYTQLGMAALLPHEDLSFSDDFSGVLADEKRTAGLDNRRKVLEQCRKRVTAVRAEDFLKMPAKTDGRELARNHDLIFIFHNGIDKVGDSRDSEEKTFEAVENELETLMSLVKRIAAMNGNNILITADHGFIYQNESLETSDYATYDPPAGMETGNRRFVIGKELKPQPSLRHFTAEQLGLKGKADVLIPKSINRLRVHGAGSRYVHGGASLQEVVVPVLAVNKKRVSDVEYVEVDVLQSNTRVTSRQVVISFVQSIPAGGKILPRDIRAAFYDQEGNALTDVHDLRFDSSAEDAREREKKVTFTFSKTAGGKNQQTITLRLDTPAAKGTSHWRHYRDYTYQLNLSFASEFDDF